MDFCKHPGCSSARSASMCTSKSFNGTFFFCKIDTTSQPMQPPNPRRISSIGCVAASNPDASFFVSIDTQWLLSAFPTKEQPSICLTIAFIVLHSTTMYFVYCLNHLFHFITNQWSLGSRITDEGRKRWKGKKEFSSAIVPLYINNC